MAELETIHIRHPRIDDGARVIEVPASALGHYRRSGWEQVTEAAEDPPDAASADSPPTTEQQDTEAPTLAGASPLEGTEQPPRRRRAPRGNE